MSYELYFTSALRGLKPGSQGYCTVAHTEGMPDLLIEIFLGSPAWAVIADAFVRGAIVAGCSAGAMAVGPATVRVRELRDGGPSAWSPALGLTPHICTVPHFNRIHEFVAVDCVCDRYCSVEAISQHSDCFS